MIWLPDLDEWAEGIAAVLAPNGRFVLVEFHPFAMRFDEKWFLAYPYGGGTPMTEAGGVGDYVADSTDLVLPGAPGVGVENAENPFPSCEFNWSIAEVLGAARRPGLTIESFDEYPYANGRQGFEEMTQLGDKRWGVPAGRPEIPLMYSLSVRLADGGLFPPHLRVIADTGTNYPHAHDATDTTHRRRPVPSWCQLLLLLIPADSPE